MIRLCYTNLYLFDRSSFLCLEELEYHLYPHTPTDLLYFCNNEPSMA